MSGDGEDPVSQMARAALNVVSAGLVDYQGGEIKKGGLTNAIDEGIGELSGRNMARKAAMEAKDAVNEEKDARSKALKEEQALKERNDRSASMLTGAIRSTANAKSDVLMGTPEKDFLGL
jgi:hypothetical protein